MAQIDPKKIAISGFVLVSFVLYSFSMRHDETPSVVTPNKSAGASAATNTTSSGQKSQTSPTSQSAAKYKDGKYTGSTADAFYGNIQVEATISGGKITDVVFLQYPNDRPQSVSINSQAMPYLKQEAIQAQNAQVDGISGATDTSQAFVESLTAALNKAM